MTYNGLSDFLMHEGKPERSGRYRWGSGERPYQRLKIGAGRYQNSKGELTETGKKRLKKEEAKNARKKDQLNEAALKDVDRWVKDDIEKSKKVMDTSSELVKQLQRIEKDSRPTPTKTRMDLSSMTDQEMRQKINRELIERQYNDLFGVVSKPKISKGREYAKMTLDVAGSVLAIGSSALGIALAVKQLKD